MPPITIEPFATVAELQQRWQDLNADEQARAKVTLQDATAYIMTLCKQSGVELPTPDKPDGLMSQNLKSVCCGIVRRMLSSADALAGVKSSQTMTGPFMETFSYENPTGDMYLTAAEKKLLGIGRQRISCVNTLGR